MQLLLIDDDAVFRLGLRLWLSQFADWQVVVDSGDAQAAWTWLLAALEDDAEDRPEVNPILVIVSVTLGQGNLDQTAGLTLCQQIKARYPAVAVLVLSELSQPVMMAAAQQAGANGYCPKALPAEELRQAIAQVARGGSCWRLPEAIADGLRSDGVRIGGDRPPNRLDPQPATPGIWAIARRNLRQSGLRQINSALTEITAQLDNPDLTTLEHAILTGRRRELRAARWLVNRLLSSPEGVAEPSTHSPLTSPKAPSMQSSSAPVSPGDGLSPGVTALSVVGSEGVSAANAHTLQSVLFDAILGKLQTSLLNRTERPLEIDILRDDKKRELVYIVTRKFEEGLGELRFSQVQPDQLNDKRSPILLDLWRSALTDFLGKYYTLSINRLDVEVVGTLLQDAALVQTTVLDRIPGVTELLAHLLFQTPFVIDGAVCPAGNPAALARAELLLDNLLIHMANAVMQPLLNRFADVEAIKHNFYDRRLMSSREIERFRNDLSWHYRLERLIGEPKNIFESQYCLYALDGRGIRQTTVYAPRKDELEQLSGLQLAVTLVLETRDAIAPRLRSALSIVGSGVIYLLTDVIGRGIGLVGRGILKGVGSAWQDSKFSRSSEQQK
ncbi:MAG TPA: DUF3685 domain-containing protein [Chroococcidiopsis sp.]